MLLRFLISFYVIVTAVSAAYKEECLQLYSPEAFDCCITQLGKKDVNENQPTNKDEIVKEIDGGGDGINNSSYSKIYNCDFEIYVAKVRGLTTADDGTFDKKAVENFVNEYLNNKPELAGTVINSCVNGDLTGYGPPELKCDLIRLGTCVQLHYLSSCNEWDKSESCTKTEELVKTCVE
ncbi:hypothetical protein NE865_05301 [Phthorimaea operculella]|nr:hypothetical protein NE865_05301 [Phthorimaea operculella]